MAKKVVNKKIGKTINKSKERHWGISVLAILAYLNAVCTLILGLFLIAGSAVVESLITKFAPDYAWATNLGIAGLIFFGLVLFGFAVLDFFIGKGLWKGQNWARIITLVLIILVGISALFSFDIFGIIVCALVIWYLGFFKPAVDYFK